MIRKEAWIEAQLSLRKIQKVKKNHQNHFILLTTFMYIAHTNSFTKFYPHLKIEFLIRGVLKVRV